MKSYQGAIVGYGGMGKWHHRDLCKTDRIHFTGVFDIDPARCALAQSDGIQTVYPSLQALLDDPSIDFIVCATPNNFHKDICIAAMRAGKHVICEKPVAMSSNELREMMQVRDETGKIFTVHQNRREDRDYLIVKDTIQTGRLGEVFSIESRVTGSKGIPQGWRQYAVAGGGMMLDWGVHLIDQLVMLFAPEKVVSVYCDLYHVAYQECDDGFKMIMKFESGKMAMVEVGTSHYIQAPRWFCFGSKGAVTVNDWNCGGKIVYAKDRVVTFEEEIIQTKAGPTKTMGPRPKDTIDEIILNPDDFAPSDHRIYYRNFQAVLDGTAPLKVKPEEAMRVMQVMEAAFESGKTGETVHTSI